MHEKIERFLNRVAEAAENGVVVKMTLSKPALKNDDLRNVYVKPVLIKTKRMFAFTYRYTRRDEVKNYDLEQTLDNLRALLPSRFLNAVLFSVSEDVTLLIGTKGNVTLQNKKVQACREQCLEHDKQKNRLIDASNPWWYQLGLTTREGKVTADMQHKFKQICRYTEIVEGLMKPMRFEGVVHVADMGAGKGYLTFALHELLTRKMALAVDVKGVEIRPDLVEKINTIIKTDQLQGLAFVEGAIDTFSFTGLDVLIALHACDTATDDAIASGIKAGARLIVCAPCCHKQIRQEMEKSGVQNPITRYGVFLERQAVMVTDTIRALILEYHGYKTQVMEFVEMEHTPKNVLLAGTYSGSPTEERRTLVAEQIASLKQQFGIKEHFLEKRLGVLF